MDNLADLSIEEAKAKIWIGDVNSELEDVKLILSRVNTSLTTTVDSEDSIMSGIYSVAKAMESAWDTMCGGFRDAQSKLEEAIKAIVQSAQEVVEETNTLKAKMGQ